MRTAIQIIGVTLAALGLFKLAWLPAFGETMERLQVVSPDMRLTLVVLVPTAELIAGVSLVRRPLSIWPKISSVFFLGCMIIGSGLMDPATSAGGCGCLGAAGHWFEVPAVVMSASAWGMLVALAAATVVDVQGEQHASSPTTR